MSVKKILSIKEIKELKDPTKQYKEYGKRVKSLRLDIIEFSQKRIEIAHEISECQEEQKKLITNAMELNQQKKKHNKKGNKQG